MPEMQVMLNEIRTRFGRDPDWVPDIALAERLYQIGFTPRSQRYMKARWPAGAPKRSGSICA